MQIRQQFPLQVSVWLPFSAFSIISLMRKATNDLILIRFVAFFLFHTYPSRHISNNFTCFRLFCCLIPFSHFFTRLKSNYFAYFLHFCCFFSFSLYPGRHISNNFVHFHLFRCFFGQDDLNITSDSKRPNHPDVFGRSRTETTLRTGNPAHRLRSLPGVRGRSRGPSLWGSCRSRARSSLPRSVWYPRKRNRSGIP